MTVDRNGHFKRTSNHGIDEDRRNRDFTDCKKVDIRTYFPSSSRALSFLSIPIITTESSISQRYLSYHKPAQPTRPSQSLDSNRQNAAHRHNRFYYPRPRPRWHSSLGQRRPRCLGCQQQLAHHSRRPRPRGLHPHERPQHYPPRCPLRLLARRRWYHHQWLLPLERRLRWLHLNQTDVHKAYGSVDSRRRQDRWTGVRGSVVPTGGA